MSLLSDERTMCVRLVDVGSSGKNGPTNEDAFDDVIGIRVVPVVSIMSGAANNCGGLGAIATTLFCDVTALLIWEAFLSTLIWFTGNNEGCLSTFVVVVISFLIITGGEGGFEDSEGEEGHDKGDDAE